MDTDLQLTFSVAQQVESMVSSVPRRQILNRKVQALGHALPLPVDTMTVMLALMAITIPDANTVRLPQLLAVIPSQMRMLALLFQLFFAFFESMGQRHHLFLSLPCMMILRIAMCCAL